MESDVVARHVLQKSYEVITLSQSNRFVKFLGFLRRLHLSLQRLDERLTFHDVLANRFPLLSRRLKILPCARNPAVKLGENLFERRPLLRRLRRCVPQLIEFILCRNHLGFIRLREHGQRNDQCKTERKKPFFVCV